MKKFLTKKVPFVKNTPDDKNCVNAVLRMVHKYFFKENITWNEINKLTKVEPGKAVWTFVGEMELAKKGLEVTNIEPIDFERFYKEGKGYLFEVVGKEVANYYIERSNINSVMELIPEYLETVTHITRKSNTQEIVEYLKMGYLVGAEVNSAILNDSDVLNLHFVLLYDFDGENLVLHDPGLPPVKGRKLSTTKFKQAFEFTGAGQGAILFRKLG